MGPDEHPCSFRLTEHQLKEVYRDEPHMHPKIEKAFLDAALNVMK